MALSYGGMAPTTLLATKTGTSLIGQLVLEIKFIPFYKNIFNIWLKLKKFQRMEC